MSNQQDDIRQWIQELITRSATDQIDNLKRFDEMMRRASRGEINQGTLRDEYVRFARDENMRYISDLTRVGLGFYNTLLELNRQYNDRFFNRVLKNHQTPSGDGETEPARVKVVAMDLSGPLGGTASHSFIIENHRTEPVMVAFLVSEFTSQDGSQSFRPPLQLDPARFTLRPGEENQVDIQIPLLPELFNLNQVYSATVVVSGFEGLQLQLRVWAQEAEDAGLAIQPAPARQPPKSKPAGAAKPADMPPDDLTRLKGIGPAYQNKLQKAGIRTYTALAALNESAIQELLGEQALQRSRRDQWRAQAQLAAQGDWPALDKLQKKLA